MAEEGSKLTLRRLEAPIHKFIKVALPTDLERLQKHHNNILKFQQSQQWDRLHLEHINASRTVQQLRANMREMEKLCMRVRAEDAPALDALVQPVRDRASAAARDFLLLHSNPVPQPAPKTPPAAQPNRCVSSSYHDDDDVCEGPLSGRQIQLQLPEIPADQSAAESWDNLEEDLNELSGLVMEFSLLVHVSSSERGGYTHRLRMTAGAPEAPSPRQEERLRSSRGREGGFAGGWRVLHRGRGMEREEQAGRAEERLTGEKKAVGYKLALLPVAGALLGGVLGGPLGLLVGFKAAGVAAALGGGVLGYAGGNLVQKQRKAGVDLQMKRLTAPPPEPETHKDK
ncbi:Syntaxin-17 [Dissostichus eleginoides]|uniref:Syntaxin-17 n=1 Tax=Dissostichus eleginoides TaxID=100907 RepID=A0AAD9F6U8_DISEL|nr:Syntaxin-17 [Dissostichus eleginoides]